MTGRSHAMAALPECVTRPFWKWDARGPLNLWACGAPDLHDLSAAYAFGIAKARAFVDGNRRTDFVTALTFLRLNAAGLVPDQVAAVRMMEGLADGSVPEAEFARWLREGAGPV